MCVCIVHSLGCCWLIEVLLCADVPNTFSAFMQLAIRQRQVPVVVRLCDLHFQHSSLISWHQNPELLWNTITFLLSQCAGDCHSRFAAAAIPLVELAMRTNVYPRLTDMKHPRRGLLYLWDFMSQAEVYMVLCVYLQSVLRQHGSSQMSLDFSIVASRRPSDMQPQLPVFSAEPGDFVKSVECALVDNLQLSPADFRRTGSGEWWVMIEDVARVVEPLPIDTLIDSNVYKPAVCADRRRQTVAESRGSSSVSSSSDSRVTPKRKVLLATPSAVPAATCEKVQHPNVMSHPEPLTTSSMSRTPTSMLQPGRRFSHGAVPVLPVTPHVQLRLPDVSRDNFEPVISQNSAVPVSAPVVNFNMPPPGYNGAMSTPVAYCDASRPHYPGPAPLLVPPAQQNPASPAMPMQKVINPAENSSAHHGACGPVMSGPAVMPSSVSGTVPVGQMSQGVSGSSVVFPCYTSAAALPVSMSKSCLPTQHLSYRQQLHMVPFRTPPPPPPVARCRMTTAGNLRAL